jgi:hypothetical protein
MVWVSRAGRNKSRDEDGMAQGGGGRDRLLEIIAVLLLGLATLGTAWCGFEAAQWSGNSSDLARQASDEHVESARLFGVATQKISYDGTMVAQYALAATQGNEQLLEFYRNSLIRPDFLPVLEEWVAQVQAGQSPTPLLEDPDYLATELADYQAAVAVAEQSSVDSQTAGDNASKYVAMTILLAAALFFAGVTSSFRYRPARVMLIAAALVTMAYAASRLSTLPVLL